MVYVLDKNNKPLMPTKRHGKVKHLLKSGKAVVINREPFTIKLLYNSEGFTQAVTLGVDAGSKTIGLSAATKDQELYASEIQLRTDIVGLLSERRQYRRIKRNRLRYRKAKFDNRTATKKPGWLAPSIRHKIESHIKVVGKLHQILPISNIIVEVAAFDIQKIKNPNISGAEYQQGDQLDSWNVREYVLFRDNHKCQHCHGKSGDKVLNTHHVESRQTGGDSPGNLVTLCKTCHDKYHACKIELDIKRNRSFRDTAFMGIMRWSFYNKLKDIYPDVSLTYGYITKCTRIENDIEKTHAADAFCIAGNIKAKRQEHVYMQKFVRHSNRCLHKANLLKGGIKKSNKLPVIVKGYRLFDKVSYENQESFIFGRRATGYFDLRLLDGTKIHASASYKKLKLLNTAKTLLTERRAQGL
ncbi:MAG TPA: RNA-guided endonuclease IscB [Anaerovoracaceae bacterium]|nr:RNA-guided endonuclease IscB [Anaerovoracaceae bacterium]